MFKIEQPFEGGKQLLIDMSVISAVDAGTGIQRVVRNLYQELLAAPPEGYRVCPIVATRKQGYYYLPTDFFQQPTKMQGLITKDPVQVSPGDFFLGLDLAAHIVPYRLTDFLQWKRQGVRVYFFLYDLLPIIEPAWFNPNTTQNFRRWLRALAIIADEVIAISQVVSADFGEWMKNSYGLSEFDLPCTSIQLGADLNVGQTSIDLAKFLPPQMVVHKFILMVGTIEPRKGYTDVLDAFDEYWGGGGQASLIIVGKQGWKMQPFLQRLQVHGEIGKHLLWLNGPDDERLQALYQGCSGLIMASKGEGLGLPLIEVSCFNKPVLARDIPVFREIAGDNVTFFPIQSSGLLPKILVNWINGLGMKNDRPSVLPKPVTWAESRLQLVKILFGTFHQQVLPVPLTPILGPTTPFCK